MSAQTFNYGSGSADEIAGLTRNMASLNTQIGHSIDVFNKLAGKVAVFGEFAKGIRETSAALNQLNAPGAALNASLADLSSISGQVGAGLELIGENARNTAKAFGGSASQSVESYKQLLMQLSPELAKAPAALKVMGDHVAVLSKTMKNDTAAAAEVLTTAMNQYGVSLADPMDASRKMGEMMNIMAAAGKSGSAELPAIKLALEQCGAAARGANVSFAEANASIQVLDNAGRKGAEGGMALRGVMTTLAAGNFLPEEVRGELAAAGVDVHVLADKSKTLAERLEPLKIVMNDSALLTKVFGRENSDAAQALVRSTSELKRYTEQIVGTNTANEQAATIMESYPERQARVQSWIENFKISIFGMTGEVGIWVGALAGAAEPLAQLGSFVTDIGTVMNTVKGIDFGGMFKTLSGVWKTAREQLGLLKDGLLTGADALGGFLKNTGQATKELISFTTKGLKNMLKEFGNWASSLVNSGTASETFANLVEKSSKGFKTILTTLGTASVGFVGVVSSCFMTFKTVAASACRSVGIAIMNIPIIGWIAAAVAGLVALGVYFWNTSAKFRAVLKGLWAVCTESFGGIWELAKNVFGSLGDLILAAFSFDGKGIKAAIDRLKGGFTEFGKSAGNAFNEAYDAEIARSKQEQALKDQQADPETPVVLTPEALAGGAISTGLAGIGGTAEGGGKVKTISVNIERIIDRFEIHTTNLHEDVSRVRDMVANALIEAVNDVNHAV